MLSETIVPEAYVALLPWVATLVFRAFAVFKEPAKKLSVVRRSSKATCEVAVDKEPIACGEPVCPNDWMDCPPVVARRGVYPSYCG